MHRIQFQALHENAKIPAKGSDLAAGYDLYAVEDQVIHPGEKTTIPLGFATALPPEIHARIESRSGNALKGYVVLTGVIDADYRGEWKVIVANLSNMPWQIAAGDRVAQVVLRPTLEALLEPVEALDSTSRGAGGFGSTGRA